MKLSFNEWLLSPLFAWMNLADIAILANCFDMYAEKLLTGQVIDSKGRLGYLLSGQVVLLDKIPQSVTSDMAFGVQYKHGREASPNEIQLKALEDSVIIWADAEIMTSVCYRACWFHGRFIDEVKKRLPSVPSIVVY